MPAWHSKGSVLLATLAVHVRYPTSQVWLTFLQAHMLTGVAAFVTAIMPAKVDKLAAQYCRSGSDELQLCLRCFATLAQSTTGSECTRGEVYMQIL